MATRSEAQESRPDFNANSPASNVRAFPVRPGNWFAVSRTIFEHPIVGPGQPVEPADKSRLAYARMEAWLDLLQLAAFSPRQVDNKGHTITLERGQLMAARSYLTKRWNWTDKTLRSFLNRLEKNHMIGRATAQKQGQRKGNQNTVITIANYERFQSTQKNEGPAVGPERGQQRASQGPESNTSTAKHFNQDFPQPPAESGGREGDASQDESEVKSRAEASASPKPQSSKTRVRQGEYEPGDDGRMQFGPKKKFAAIAMKKIDWTTANMVLSDARALWPGTEVGHVDRAHLETSGKFETNETKCVSLASVVKTWTRSAALAAATAQYGSPEKLAGGAPGKLGRSTCRTHWCVLSQRYLDRIRAAYPLATLEQLDLNEIVDAAPKCTYGTTLQTTVESELEGLARERHEKAAKEAETRQAERAAQAEKERADQELRECEAREASASVAERKRKAEADAAAEEERIRREGTPQEREVLAAMDAARARLGLAHA